MSGWCHWAGGGLCQPCPGSSAPAAPELCTCGASPASPRGSAPPEQGKPVLQASGQRWNTNIFELLVPMGLNGKKIHSQQSKDGRLFLFCCFWALVAFLCSAADPVPQWGLCCGHTGTRFGLCSCRSSYNYSSAKLTGLETTGTRGRLEESQQGRP